ncbi:MAG: DUF4136 domain-containing protein [Reichenbachiella sp.]
MKNFVMFALSAAIFASCSSIKVTTDYDKSVDFSQHKTLEYYGWADNSDKILNRFDKERIEKAFGDEFEKRGIKLVEKGQGDIIVTLFIVAEQKTQTTANTTSTGGYGGGYGYGRYGHGPGYGWGAGHSTTTYSESDYTVGTLVVSVYDAKEKLLIWESTGKGTISEKEKGREERAAKGATRIMKDYPVAPLK